MLTAKDIATIFIITAAGGVASILFPGNIVWLLGSILATSLALSTWYAIRIYRRPFDPDLTWLSVAVGCGMYAISLGAFQWVTTGSLLMACMPLAWFLPWGIPMIISQVLKNSRDVDDATRLKRSLRRSHDF